MGNQEAGGWGGGEGVNHRGGKVAGATETGTGTETKAATTVARRAEASRRRRGVGVGGRQGASATDLQTFESARARAPFLWLSQVF